MFQICLPMGVIYYITIPSMYLFLTIYSVFNLNVVSWGTREVPKKKTADEMEQVGEGHGPQVLKCWIASLVIDGGSIYLVKPQTAVLSSSIDQPLLYQNFLCKKFRMPGIKPEISGSRREHDNHQTVDLIKYLYQIWFCYRQNQQGFKCSSSRIL